MSGRLHGLRHNRLHFSLLVLVLFTVVATIPGGFVVVAQVRPAPQAVAFPSSFPPGEYTPHGYLDNPYHSMVLNRSGILRSVPPVGFGWWKTGMKGSYGSGASDHLNYLSLLVCAVSVDGTVFADTADFSRNGAALVSRYHTKHAMQYNWEFQKVTIAATYFLPRENTLACLLQLSNTNEHQVVVDVSASHIYAIGAVKWWGSDGLVARALPNGEASVAKVWAYGDVFALGADHPSRSARATASEAEWKRWLRTDDTATVSVCSAAGRGPIWTLRNYRIIVPPKGTASLIIFLARGKNEAGALDELEKARTMWLPELQRRLAEDDQFWTRCPVLEGDWPESWKHGWVYDFETLRMNVRRPIGIFRHPWDAMQVHSPRVVLGETSIDMMTLSYADDCLATEVMEGTFADAIAPNVPCVREDGSVNMVSADGSECGTAPMWAYPFHCIWSMYERNGDRDWIGRLYPYLRSYVEWWLENRTDGEGWLHCNNSWESGQDGSRRFLVAERNEGAVADFVRTVDVEASVAEAMRILSDAAGLLGKPEESGRWKNMAEDRVRRTRSMFFDGWFRDVDARTGAPIVLKDYFDIMMLSPLTCGVAAEAQIDAVRPMFQYYLDHPRWLEWPPKMQTYVEAAWTAGERSSAAEAVASAADRVYRRTDGRTVQHADSSEPFSYRVPGVANEFWPIRDDVPAGGENYGWGATLPLFIIRSIVGYRELDAVNATGFWIAPAIPRQLLISGNSIGIRTLHYRNSDVSLQYEIRDSGALRILLTIDDASGQTPEIRHTGKRMEVSVKKTGRVQVISFEGRNMERYEVRWP